VRGAGWEHQAHPRRIDWWRVAGAVMIFLSGLGLALLLWVCWLVYVTALSVAG
jgi:hypothetical protein